MDNYSGSSRKSDAKRQLVIYSDPVVFKLGLGSVELHAPVVRRLVLGGGRVATCEVSLALGWNHVRSAMAGNNSVPLHCNDAPLPQVAALALACWVYDDDDLLLFLHTGREGQGQGQGGGPRLGCLTLILIELGAYIFEPNVPKS